MAFPDENAAIQHRFSYVDGPRLFIQPTPKLQVQRVYLSPGSRLTSVTLEIDGSASEYIGDLVIFDHQGGLIAPRLTKAQLRIPVAKNHDGIEEVRVSVAPALIVGSGQLFIGMENVSMECRVLMVRDTSVRACSDEAGMRSPVVYDSDGRNNWKASDTWFVGGVEYVESEDRILGQFVRDSTFDARNDRVRIGPRYISVGDLDCDGLPDIAVAGMLHLSSFQGELSMDLGTDSAYPWIMFVDVDGDNRDDMITMDLPRDRYLTKWRFVNGKLSKMATTDLGSEMSPVSATIVANGQATFVLLIATNEREVRSILIPMDKSRNTASTLESRAMDIQSHFDYRTMPTIMAVDLNDDLQTEIVYRSLEEDRLLYLDESENLHVLESSHHVPYLYSSTASPIVSATGIFVNLPRAVAWSMNTSTEDNRLQWVTQFFSERMRYDERVSCRRSVDLDNDGVEELIEFGFGDCRSVVVFAEVGGKYQDVTEQYGLHFLRGIEDAAFTDIDGDGRIDIIVDTDNGSMVYLNRVVTQGDLITKTVRDLNAGSSVKRNDRIIQTVVRGHGHLIQELPVVVLHRFSEDTLTISELVRGNQSRSAISEARYSAYGDITEKQQEALSIKEGISVSQQGKHVVVTSKTAQQSIHLRVVSIDGRTVTSIEENLLTSGVTRYAVYDQLLAIGASAGVYTIHVAVGQLSTTTSFTYVP